MAQTETLEPDDRDCDDPDGRRVCDFCDKEIRWVDGAWRCGCDTEGCETV